MNKGINCVGSTIGFSSWQPSHQQLEALIMLGQCAMCLLDEAAMNAEWSPAGGAWRSGSQSDGPLHRYARMCRIKCILQGYNIPFTPWQLRVYSHVYSSGRPAWPRGALAESSTKLANQCARSLAQVHTLFKTNGDSCRLSQAKFCFKLFCVGWIQHRIRAAGGS